MSTSLVNFLAKKVLEVIQNIKQKEKMEISGQIVVIIKLDGPNQ